jgi:hypothetical protein
MVSASRGRFGYADGSVDVGKSVTPQRVQETMQQGVSDIAYGGAYRYDAAAQRVGGSG